MIGAYFGAIALTLFGGFALYSKYRIVIGGVACQAEIKRQERFYAGRGPVRYRFVLSFPYRGRRLVRPSISSTYFKDRGIGETRTIYYNERRPKHVVIKGFVWDICYGVLFLLPGLAMLYALITHS